MLHSHQANAKVIFSMMFGVNSCIENNVTHLFAVSLSRSLSLGVNKPQGSIHTAIAIAIATLLEMGDMVFFGTIHI